MSISGLLALGRFVVGLNVEVDEKAEVAGEKQATEDRCTFSSSASPKVGQLRFVSGRKVRISFSEGNFNVLEFFIEV